MNNPADTDKVPTSYRVHKVALRPTPSQEARFRRHATYGRLVYNWGVEQFRACLDAYKADPENAPKWPTGYDLCTHFNKVKDERIPWGRACYQALGMKVLLDVGAAIKAYGAGRKAGRHVGIPRFKNLYAPQSFRADNGADVVKALGDNLQMPAAIAGDGRTVRCHERLRWDGTVKECTVLRNGKRWFATVVFEAPSAPVRALGTAGGRLGIDLGVSTLATCSDGSTYENPRQLRTNLSNLRTLQKALSRRENGSRRKAIMRAKVGELHAQIKRARMDHFRKVAATIVAKPCERIVIETLNIRGMVRNRRLSRAISDASMGTFALMLQEAAKAAGKVVEKVDQWYPSTKLCSGCGTRANITLSIRTYRCEQCGLEMDRDLNAAINLASAPTKGAA